MKIMYIKIILMLISISTFSQNRTVIFSVENGITDNKLVIAVPIVIYNNGTYYDPPRCAEFYSDDAEEIAKCKKAKEILLPIINKADVLYILNNGIQTGKISVSGKYDYGLSDWATYSAIISNDPDVKCLTNNSLIGKNELKELSSKPILKVRKGPEGQVFKSTILTKIDIDLDGVPELIYKSDEYEGHYFTIYTFKNNKWRKVYEGGYQGV